MEDLMLAFEILQDADVIEVFDDSLFIKVDKELWDDLWSYNREAPDEMA